MKLPIEPHDQEIDALLAADSTLMQRYRSLPKSEPGKPLDIAILGRAANAVRNRSAARSRWLLPIASAASVVVAASIGWRVHLANQAETASPVNPAVNQPHDVMEVDLFPPDEKKRALEMATLPPEAPEPPASKLKSPPVKAEQKTSTLDEIIASSARDTGITVESKVEAHAASDISAFPSLSEQERTMPDKGFGAVIGTNNTTPTDKAAETTIVTEPAPTFVGKKTRDSTSSYRAEPATGAPPAPPLPDEMEADEFAGNTEISPAALSPADWIERIRLLARARRFNEVRAEIREFRRFYPDYRLPSDLRRYGR